MKRTIFAFLLIALAACGGGGGGGGSSTAPAVVTHASPGGIWQGTDSLSGLGITGIITESGEFHFLRQDGSQYFGTLTTSGSSISGSFTGVVPLGDAYADGSTYGTGTFSGTLVERQTISASLTYTTALGAKSTDSLDLKFNSVYTTGSSLAAIAGTYLDSSTNSVVNVNGQGIIFEQQGSTGCVINGQVSLIDSSYDAYQVQYSFSGCQGSYAVLNNTTATGLGAIDTTVNPVVAYVGVVNTSAHYALTAAYTQESGAGSYTIGGTVSGLASGAEVTLADNGTDELTVTSNAAFSFSTTVAHNGTYSVAVKTQPTGQICTVSNGSGAGVTANVSSVTVSCSTESFAIGGAIAGLTTGQQVTLYDNGGDALVLTGNGPFTFPTPVSFNGGYLVTINAQPMDQTCTVSNDTGAGVMGTVTNVKVTCSTNTYTVGGILSGLTAGAQVTLYDNGADSLTLLANGPFRFTAPIVYNGSYSVTVGTQPTGEVCTVSNSSGAGVAANATDANVICSTTTYPLGGTLSGLASGQEVTLSNNGADTLTLTANAAFTFATPVAYKGSYAVTVSTQPIGQSCSITDGTGSGVMAAVSNVSVLCSNVSPGGIWQGIDPVTGSSLYGIVTESGQFDFLRGDGTQYFGTLTLSGNALSGTLTGIAAAGQSFADGSTYGTGTISGSILQTRQSAIVQVDFITSGGTYSGEVISLTYNALYESGSALSTIAGSYSDAASNSTISVNGSGVVFEQQPNTGCVINGQIYIIDSHYDAYQVQYSFSGCQGSATYLNGTTATGLGVLDTTVSPVVAYIGVANSAAHYVLTTQYAREQASADISQATGTTSAASVRNQSTK